MEPIALLRNGFNIELELQRIHRGLRRFDHADEAVPIVEAEGNEFLECVYPPHLICEVATVPVRPVHLRWPSYGRLENIHAVTAVEPYGVRPVVSP
jgi:hypothetical protein